MKKTLSFILALLTSASLLASCSGGDTSAETTAAETTSAAETTAPETTLYMPDDLADDLDFNGAEVHTFGWEGSTSVEFDVEQQDGDVVNDAIYERNRKVEERLNVDLTFTLIPGANAQRADWVNAVSNSIMAGDGANDIAAGYSMCGASLAAARMLIDLTSLDHIDFEKPWWPSSLTEAAICDGKLYFASGDISTNMIHYLYGVFFNKEMAEAYGINDIYSMVRDGSWTIDKMAEISASVYNDLNGNGTKDAADRFGFMTHRTFSDNFYYAAGLRVTEIGSDGLPEISDDYKGEKVHSLLEQLVGYFGQNSWYLSNDYEEARNIFLEERALFYLTEVLFATTHLRASEVDYGIIPTPKGSEAQEEYRTVTSFPYTLYGVPIDAKDPDMSAAVLECMASESYRTVSPALFETALKVKYASDDDTSEMYDIIRESVLFDFGRIFNDNLGAQTWAMFRGALANNNTDWMSVYASAEKSLEAQFDKVIESLTKDID